MKAQNSSWSLTAYFIVRNANQFKGSKEFIAHVEIASRIEQTAFGFRWLFMGIVLIGNKVNHFW